MELLRREYDLWPYLWTNIPKYNDVKFSKVIFVNQKGDPWDESLYRKLTQDCGSAYYMEKVVIMECRL